MERVKLDIWVGIFVALGIIAMFYMATRVGNLTSNDVKETYEVKAYFENIGGLKPRAAVKASGVVVVGLVLLFSTLKLSMLWLKLILMNDIHFQQIPLPTFILQVY